MLIISPLTEWGPVNFASVHKLVQACRGVGVTTQWGGRRLISIDTGRLRI